MVRLNNIVRFFIITLLFTVCIPSLGQNRSNLTDRPLGSIWFIGKSTKLTKDAKAILDTIIQKILDSSMMNVQVISFNKDLCDKCGERSWKRVNRVLIYLSKHGVSNNRLSFTNRLAERELNKVDVFFVIPTSNIPHPTTPTL